MVTKNQGVQQAYNTQILVDATAGFIVGVAVSAHAGDITELGAVLDAAVGGRAPAQLLADAGYGAAADPPGQDERVHKAQFTYDQATDRYHCPGDQWLPFPRTRNAACGGGRADGGAAGVSE